MSRGKSRYCEDCGAEEAESAYIICWVCAGYLVDKKPIIKPPKSTWWKKIKEWSAS